MNYYEILEVGENASNEVIKAAYKTMAKKYHPDNSRTEEVEQKEENMRLINEAYENLISSQLRQKHDKNLFDQRNLKNHDTYKEIKARENTKQNKTEFCNAEVVYVIEESKLVIIVKSIAKFILKLILKLLCIILYIIITGLCLFINIGSKPIRWFCGLGITVFFFMLLGAVLKKEMESIKMVSLASVFIIIPLIFLELIVVVLEGISLKLIEFITS